MNYEILYEYATKNHLSYNELCATVNTAAKADLDALDASRQDLARIYRINQSLIGKLRTAGSSSMCKSRSLVF